MRRNISQSVLLVVLLALVAGVIGCSTGRSGKVATTTTTKTTVTTKAGTQNSAYGTVDYAQLVQPAFVNDYANKNVQFTAYYDGTVDQVTDLPDEYRSNFVRLALTSDAAGTNPSNNFIVNKAIAGPILKLSKGQRVLVRGHGMAMTQTAAATGSSAPAMLFVVDSVEPQS